MAYYKRIRDLREDAEITQAEVAEYLNTTTQYYGKYEKGEREIPFSRVIELADFYNVSIDYIAERTGIKKIRAYRLKEDEILLLEKFSALSERNKGKVELFIEQLADSSDHR